MKLYRPGNCALDLELPPAKTWESWHGLHKRPLAEIENTTRFRSWPKLGTCVLPTQAAMDEEGGQELMLIRKKMQERKERSRCLAFIGSNLRPAINICNIVEFDLSTHLLAEKLLGLLEVFEAVASHRHPSVVQPRLL